ncbi:chemotaxis protein CheW [Burkholderia glumae]|uniref:Chemotaxis protein CheW n=1 Tax=Burkholderia glumae TaxID=337 RepID=A0AAP9Y3B7_BURGL|nr:chemotaxis protein CheW [Burkholderia glumae]ACR29345.1 Chemotaxis protein CheW [Burkholderia glumae BGR1]AJY67906.1 cheW-like domain protein [Burkholderia glumae LMG 2196 = ATCC 33617]KHJ61379.1 chemotaxis protein CheW [Burkholderia glumae]MCM2482928.1 chemotaxis protein CheW [Burkholderia glumae]MCM2506244.1 chemotaxis protein CheW [Burkholderia glumae]
MNAVREISREGDAHGENSERDAQEFVTLRLGAEEYGIDILCVQEIRSYEAPTRIANAPAHITGVVNLRGVIVPIMDLRIKFALESVEYNESTVVIVLNVGSRTVGIVVDAVGDVLKLKPADRRPAPALGASIDTGFITDLGSVKGEDGERMLILLDIERLITVSDVGPFA